MALPVLSRAWRFLVNQVAAGNANAEVQLDVLMLAIVNSMLGVGTWTDSNGATQALPPAWSVTSSCNGAGGFGNNDGVNRWTTHTDLVHASPGTNHSWIVLRNNALGLELLIDLASGTTANVTTIVSHSGFGAANGGANGTATTAPTALNSITLSTVATWGGTSTINTPTIVHALTSVDGLDTRIVLCRNGHMCGLWLFARPEEIVGTWSNPYVAGLLGSNAAAPSAATPTATELASSTAIFRGFRTNAFTLGLTTEGFTGGALFNTLTTSDGYIAASNPLFGTRLASLTATHEGSRGLLVDAWLGRSNLSSGHGYPAAPVEPQFMQFGSLIVPWNKSVVVTS